MMAVVVLDVRLVRSCDLAIDNNWFAVVIKPQSISIVSFSR